MGGKIVRLTRGEAETAKVYKQFGTPLQASKRWQEEGAGKLHIIDLDAALGNGNNHSVISDIANNVQLPIQVGGGIRSFEIAEKLFKTKVSQVIIGALAFSDPSAIGKLKKQFGADSVIIALDHKDGKIMIEGWKTATTLNLKEALEKYISLGVKKFLITSIAQDGMLSGPDLSTLMQARQYPNIEVIAAGGIGSLNDLAALKSIGVEGAVIGKALYEGRFTLKEAIKAIGD
jgi:phosphoribosylformimino-5-aminoimidazole carboxamide ribotide isomerase